MIKIALCDADEYFSENLGIHLGNVFSQYDQIVYVSTFKDCNEIIHRFETDTDSYDMVFLETEMLHVQGFQIIDRLLELNPHFLLFFSTRRKRRICKGYCYHPYRCIARDQLYTKIEEDSDHILNIIINREKSRS